MVERGTGPKSLVVCCDEFRWIRVEFGSSGPSLDVFPSVVLRLLVRCPLIGCLAFPFIGQGKAGVTTEGEEENQKEKEVPRDRRVLLLFYVGPADSVDVNRDRFSLRPCPSLAPCAGIVCRSWRSTPYW